MAPSKAPKDIKIHVPRHNSQRINTKLSAEVKNHAKSQGTLVDTTQSSSKLAMAIESASEWNSRLMTARAERGPQWDVGTQQFLVDKYSDLYYDPTPLRDAVKKLTEDEDPEGSSNQRAPTSHPSNSSQVQLSHSMSHSSHGPSHHQSHGQHQPFQLQQQPSMGSRHHTPLREREFPQGMGPGPTMHGHMGGRDSIQMHTPRHAGPQANFPYAGSPSSMGMRGGPGGIPGGPGSFPGGPSMGGVGGGVGGAPFSPGASGFIGGDVGGPAMRMGGVNMGGMGGGMRPGMGGGMGGMPMSNGGMGGMGNPMGGMSGGNGMGSMGSIGVDVHGGNMAGMGMPMNMSPRGIRLPDDNFPMH